MKSILLLDIVVGHQVLPILAVSFNLIGNLILNKISTSISFL
jgi:hypothetical protein